jgi:Ca-activated chloride channel family protein
MSVTTIGLGNDYNETLMTALAEASYANYYYVADVEALPQVFREELGELKSIVAREIEIRIRCPKGVRPIRFLGRPGELKNREESLVFATLSSEQSREIYLECEIEPGALGEITEIAQVTTKFEDSAENQQQTLPDRPIVVGYTRDRKIASAVVDQAIVAEAAISRNAVEMEKAVALADEGSADGARRHLDSQKASLEAIYAEAPAAQQEILKDEIANLGAAAEELERGSLSKSQRKVLTNRAWELRNSKQK